MDRRKGAMMPRQWLRGIAQEPLFQFLVMGLLLWSGVEYWRLDHDRYVIRMGPAERERIVSGYVQQFGRTLPKPELELLIDGYIREEIFLREGLALGLDKNDEIIRRRIAQKYEFLQTDLAVTESPSENDLRHWYEEKRERYLTPARVAFKQVYFSADRDEAAAKTRAADLLEKLRASRTSHAEESGDLFPGPANLRALTQTEVIRIFGESELSEQLFTLSTGQWSGPYRSGYGWHLVYLTSHFPPALAAFGDIRDRVLRDYQEEQQRIANARSFARLRAEYTVRYDGEP
jgi:peptidyl-prolyl cis-trans isomerase C